MRPADLVLALALLTACSITHPPRCCSTPDPEPTQTLHAKADAFQRIVDEKLQPHWEDDVLLSVYFTDATMTNVAGFDDPDDAALYTGIYAASQAFRYATTRDAAALESVRGAARALHVLAATPGYTGGLARAIATADNVGAIGCPAQYCYTNKEKITWLGNTSRDQYTGWWFGNAIVYRLVDDDRIRATIRADIKEMITAIRGWNYRLHDQNGQPNSGTAGDVHHQMRITWHLIAATILDKEPERELYWEWYHEQTKALELDEAWLEDALDVTNVYYDYYGFNLGFLNAYNMVILERDPRLHKLYLDWMNRELYRYVKDTHNSFFDFLQMAMSGTSSPSVRADKESLADFPGPPAMWACISPPAKPFSFVSKWLYFTNRKFAGSHGKIIAYPQSATPYRIWQRCRHEFEWAESPYRETCCCQCATTGNGCAANTNAPAFCSGSATPMSNVLVYTGADYLAAYWLGRHHGYIDPQE